jgi:carboxyl-terminal processing protease
LIQKNYVEPVNLPDVIRSAYQGMLQSLDVFATYIPAEQMKDFKWPPSPVGALGFDVYKRHGYGIVLSLLRNSPASEAGLQAGDYIRAIGDQSTRAMSLLDIEAALDVPGGSPVKLKMMRADTFEQYEATLTRKPFKIPEPHGEPLEDASGYVLIDSFDTGTVDKLADVLSEMSNRGIKRIILDLRSCSSGDYEEAILAANLFIQSGDLLLVEGRVGKKKVMRNFPRLAKNAKMSELIAIRETEPGHEEYTIHLKALPQNDRCNVPVALLVNGATAGPAEVFAVALKDSGRAVLVGSKTAGTSSLQ